MTDISNNSTTKVRKCEQCGEEYVTSLHWSNVYFCSEDCRLVHAYDGYTEEEQEDLAEAAGVRQ